MPTIEAVVYHGPGDVRVERQPMPACGPDEIRVKVDACAVCGSDLKAFHQGNPRIRPPMVIGHEFTGCIESLGNEVMGFDVGDRIVMATSVSCGDCFYCRRGWPNLCANLAPMGFSYPGGMAEFVTVPARALQHGHVVPVPADMLPAHAALAEPVSCAVNCMANCGVGDGDTVVVVGAGPMGIINACVARESGAAQVIISEVNPARLSVAGAFGFDCVVNPAETDLREAVRGATDGVGADVVIVAAPAAAPQASAVDLARKRGTVCLFASLPSGHSELTVDSRPIHYGELRVVGSSDSTPEHVRRAVELLSAGRLPAAQLVSHQLPLAEVLEAFELMRRGEALRVVLKP